MPKAFFLPLIVFTVIIFGCEKSKSVDDLGLIGTWQLVEQSGAMTPGVIHPPANAEVLKFANASYQLYENGTLTRTGFYSTEEDSTVEEEVCLVFPDNYYSRRINFSDSVNTRKTFYRQNGDTLRLVSGCYAYDAGSTKVYARKNEITGGGD